MMVHERNQNGVFGAEVCDAHAIAEVHISSWRSAYRGLVPDEVLNSLSLDDRSRRWSETLVELNHGVLKQVVDGKIIGFSHATQSKDEDAASDTADIHAIYLAPNYIGQGYGKALMKQTLISLQRSGYSTATLWVMETNHAAIAFYESQGFVDDKVDKPYKLGGSEHTVPIKRFRLDLNKRA